MALVHITGPLRKLADGRSELELRGATVLELLQALEGAYPALGGWVLDERGVIRRHINVFVEGERAGGETSVGEHDRLDVLPAISGG